jgi:prepilin-type N-terminal cleavage/methylation domain-containing protein
MLRELAAGITSVKRTGRRKHTLGFTLIELLIVIAIILILIAIALPNFLEAQIRAKVTKAKAELRTIDIAMQEYFLDFKIYPAENEQDVRMRGWSSKGLFWLTTPIKYLGSIGADPFALRTGQDQDFLTFESGGCEAGLFRMECTYCMVTWVVYSAGPSDQGEPAIRSADPHWQGSVISYAATNGTRSAGTIHQWGGDSWFIGVRLSNAGGKKNYTPANDQPLMVNGIPHLHRMPESLK